MAIAIAAAMYLIGNCCCANCGGEYGFWNDDSFASDIIRNRRTCSYYIENKHWSLVKYRLMVSKAFRILPSIASFPVLIDFHHPAIVLLQQQVEHNHPNRESSDQKGKQNWLVICTVNATSSSFFDYLFITGSRILSAIASARSVLLQLNIFWN